MGVHGFLSVFIRFSVGFAIWFLCLTLHLNKYINIGTSYYTYIPGLDDIPHTLDVPDALDMPDAPGILKHGCYKPYIHDICLPSLIFAVFICINSISFRV